MIRDIRRCRTSPSRTATGRLRHAPCSGALTQAVRPGRGQQHDADAVAAPTPSPSASGGGKNTDRCVASGSGAGRAGAEPVPEGAARRSATDDFTAYGTYETQLQDTLNKLVAAGKANVDPLADPVGQGFGQPVGFGFTEGLRHPFADPVALVPKPPQQSAHGWCVIQRIPGPKSVNLLQYARDMRRVRGSERILTLRCDDLRACPLELSRRARNHPDDHGGPRRRPPGE